MHKHAFKLRSNVRNICNLFRGLVPFFSAINCLVVSVLSIGAPPFKILKMHIHFLFVSRM